MKKQISTLAGSIIIVVISILFFGGAFAYQYFAIKNNPSQTSNQTVTSVAKDLAMAGWKTYTNDNGYNFKYPASATLNSIIESGGDSPISNNSQVAIVKYNKRHIFEVNSYRTSLSIEDIVKQQFSGAISLRDIKIDGMDGYKVIFNYVDSNIVSDFYFLNKNDLIFELTINRNNNTANQIFSTFKFAEPTTQILDQNIRKADLTKFMTESGDMAPAYGQIINAPEYADLNNDEKEEAVFTILSGGTSGSYGPFIVGFKNNKLVKLNIGVYPKLSGEIGSIQGHTNFSIVKNNLIVNFPIYKAGDGNCCPTGGKIYFLHKWDNLKLQFVVDKTLKLGPEWDSKSAEEIKQELIKNFNI